MSRSFVRAWATVATIIALVSFAFVQPMPEHTATPSVHQQGDQETRITVAGDHVTVSPPFVDSVLTGKTFTPYLVLTRPPLQPGTDVLGRAPVLALAAIRSSDLEPPTRPG